MKGKVLLLAMVCMNGIEMVITSPKRLNKKFIDKILHNNRMCKG